MSKQQIGKRANSQTNIRQILRLEHSLFEKAGSIVGDGGLLGLSSDATQRCLDNPDLEVNFLKFLRLGGNLPRPTEHKIDTDIVPVIPTLYNSSFVKYNHCRGIVDLRELFYKPLENNWFEEYMKATTKRSKDDVDIPRLEELLGGIMAANASVHDYAYDWDFGMPMCCNGGAIIFPGTIFGSVFSDILSFRIMFWGKANQKLTKVMPQVWPIDNLSMLGKMPIHVACVKDV